MKSTDLSKYDAAERQRDVLDYVLREEKEAKRPAVKLESVDSAKHGSLQYQATSDRIATRLLFISQDASLLNQTQQTLDGYLDLTEVFDEVHIVILRQGIVPRNPVLRVAPNAWLYIASARHWWWTPMAAIKLIKDQMVFADGFRPDLIVARDAYESAWVAYSIGQQYRRPTQLHILEDFTSAAFLKRTPHARWRLRMARYFTKRFLSIRTATNQIQTLIEHYYPQVPDVATLPRFNNYQYQTDSGTQHSLKEKYPQFVFIMVYFGSLTHQSTLYQVIDAARVTLRSPHIGLVVVGDGPARKEFIERTKILGISEQVVFERTTEDIMGYLKTADTVVVSDTNGVGDEIVIRSAVAGTAIIAAKTALRRDLFIDGESALLYEGGEIASLSKKISLLLNDFILRKKLSETAQQVVASRLHENPEVYRQAYRDSVERGLFAGETEDSAVEDISESTVDEKSVHSSQG